MHRSLIMLAGAGRVAVSRVRRPTKAAIEVTDAAVGRLRELLTAKPDAVGIRVGVKQRGCNGQSYTINYATSKGLRDEEVEVKGVKVYIEPTALLSIVGTCMDWKESDLASEFVFENPNAKSVCGCGESFTT